MYWRLALHEEREVEAEMGDVYRRYAAQVPRFIPHRQAARRQSPTGHDEETNYEH